MLSLRNAFIAAALSSCAAASTALADGMVGSLKDDVAVAEPTYVWDGLYVAAGVGVGKLGDGSFDSWKSVQKQKRYCEDQIPSIADTESLDFKPQYCRNWGDWKDDGYPKNDPFAKGKFGDDNWEVFGTLQVGYDRMIHDRILIGAFTDIDFFPDADNDFRKSVYYDEKDLLARGSPGSVDGHLSLNHIWNVGGRIGLLCDPRILLFVSGGYSRADLDGDLNFDIYHGPSVTLALPNHMSGYFLGAGGEVKVDKNVSVKFEYRYTDLGSVHASGQDIDVGPAWGNYYEQHREVTTLKARADLDEQIHSVRAELVIKLGEPERHAEAVPLK